MSLCIIRASQLAYTSAVGIGEQLLNRSDHADPDRPI